MFLNLYFVVASLLVVVSSEEDNVVVLTAANFKEALEKTDASLVEFYAPWCGHCKQLEPEYASAAKELKDNYNHINVQLCKVDATAETSLAQEHNIKGYPTIKFYKSGKWIDYTGGRKSDDIVQWVLKKSGPPTQDIAKVEDLKKLSDLMDVYVLGLFKDMESAKAKAYVEAASNYDSVTFFSSGSDEIIKHVESEEGKIVLFKKFDELRNNYDGPFDAESIVNFVKENELPVIIEFSEETAPKVFGGAINVHSLLFCEVTSNKELLDQYRTAALKHRGKVIFIYLDTTKEENERVLEFFGLTKADGTQLRVIKMEKEMEKFVPEFKEFTSENMDQFVKDVIDGKIKRHLMSEEVPKDWDSKPVKVLVGGNFKEVTTDATKHVLVEFYAPWCGHCKQLAPIYEDVAAHFKNNDDIVVAKIDATKNEVDSVSVQGFPTLVLFRKDDNKLITYSGERTFDAIVEFLESGGEIQKSTEDDEPEEEPTEEPSEQEPHVEL